LRIGDKILAVDGTTLHGLDMEQIRKLVRGAAGTEVLFTIEREGERATLEYVLVREDIPVRNITYAGFIEPGIGYVRIERFSRTAANDLRTSLKDLQAASEIEGIVLDLRNNPGGLLDIAVDVVAKFIPESSLVVSTKGRQPASQRKYYSLERPMYPDIPLAVLVNENSASASEIVAGAVQDLDRGIVIGTRSFGKGLVQTITRLTATASMKITTARYYTPSGRCIQELDYAHRKQNGDATATPDSLRKEFRTSRGRVVYEAGGVTPDSIVEQPVQGALIQALYRKAMFFKYANYLNGAGKLHPSFEVTAGTIKDFQQYLTAEEFVYEESVERGLSALSEEAEASRYSAEFMERVAELGGMINGEKASAFERYRNEIRQALQQEVLARVADEHASIEASLEFDSQARAAVKLLQDRRTYSALLSP
jgi:carboxyl-terminal processing protease